MTSLEQNGVFVLRPSGALTIDTHGGLKKAARDAILYDRRRKILLDVGGISRIDSAGIGSLVTLLNIARSNDGDVRLAGEFAPAVEEPFNLCGLSRVFAKYPDVKTGVEQFDL
ncbi:MAG TPA: STAS domain-containing protein [bacterium]|nr:STAS domain-containing protein [bacterium]